MYNRRVEELGGKKETLSGVRGGRIQRPEGGDREKSYGDAEDDRGYSRVSPEATLLITVKMPAATSQHHENS